MSIYKDLIVKNVIRIALELDPSDIARPWQTAVTLSVTLSVSHTFLKALLIPYHSNYVVCVTFTHASVTYS